MFFCIILLVLFSFLTKWLGKATMFHFNRKLYKRKLKYKVVRQRGRSHIYIIIRTIKITKINRKRKEYEKVESLKRSKRQINNSLVRSILLSRLGPNMTISTNFKVSLNL